MSTDVPTTEPQECRPEDLAPDERRRRKRLHHSVDVMVTCGAMFEGTRCSDMSPGGMFVQARSTYEPGQQISLRFQVGEVSFQLEAEVAHVKPRVGFGARFLDIRADQRLHILQFVHRERARAEVERLLGDMIPV